MSGGETLERVKVLVSEGRVLISDHGYDELVADRIFFADLIRTVGEAIVVEDYPSAPKGPTVLVLQSDGHGDPVHVVWGIPKGFDGPAVLVTAYRPDASRWSADLTERRR
jgi:hypothetical protein